MNLPRYVAWACSGVLLGLLLLSGCEPEPHSATALVVSVKSDLDDLAKIEVAAFPEEEDPSSDRPEDKYLVSVNATLDDLPKSIVLTKGKSDEIMLAVRGRDKRNRILVEIRTRAQFGAGETLLLPIFLGKQCRDHACSDQARETCYLVESDGVGTAECGPIPLLRARDLEPILKPGDEDEWDETVLIAEVPSKMDGGLDGGLDGGADASDADVKIPLDTGVPDTGPEGGLCVKPPLTSAQCGTAPQCGCQTGQTCRLAGAQATACTTAIGTVPANAVCTAHGDCGAGHSCIAGRCSLYCQVDSNCGAGGACLPVYSENAPVPGVSACLTACNPATNAPCGAGLACATYTNAMFGTRAVSGSFCVKPSVDCAGLTTNSRCDDPTGTRQCAAGTDNAECGEVSCTSSNAPCGTGQCWGGLCRKACTVGGTDCPSGSTCNALLNACLTTCDPAAATNTCRTGLLCSPLGNTCVRPQGPTCPFEYDNGCDDPTDSKWCVAGTDRVDCAPASCATPHPYVGPCDLATQCGCLRGQACTSLGVSSTGAIGTQCTTPGRTAANASCTSATECRKGYGCISGKCQRFCRQSSDCNGATCSFSLTSTPDGGVPTPVTTLGLCPP